MKNFEQYREIFSLYREIGRKSPNRETPDEIGRFDKPRYILIGKTVGEGKPTVGANEVITVACPKLLR